MNKSIFIAVSLIAASAASFAQSGYKTMDLPKAPAPIKQTLPFNAQVSGNGVYVPLSKDRNTGVSFEGLKNPAQGEKGGSISGTWKFK